MSKTPEDYRNIVKILKLQLLKLRQENTTLSHQMGIISDSETSSFTPKLNHYRQSDQPFAQKVVLFLQFAHRCELVGIAPQMVFRIADKKRDKSVNSKNLEQVIKRLKLRMLDEQINKLVGILSKKGSNIDYDYYLQCVSAFQINSQKYPATSSRTYVQLCLLEFSKICKQNYTDVRKLFSGIASSQSYFKYDQFTKFCLKQDKLEDIQIAAVFLGLDIQSSCKIERQVFVREMQKIYSLIDRGLVDQKSLIIERNRRSPNKSNIKRDEDIQKIREFDSGDETGDQGFNKKQKQKKKNQSTTNHNTTNPLDKKISKPIISLLQKNKTSYPEFIRRLIKMQENKKDIYYRSFSFNEFKRALEGSQRIEKKSDVMDVFKKLDSGKNGSISTEELIKIFLRNQTQQIFNNLDCLFALFYRHLKQIQFPQPSVKFTTQGFKLNEKVQKKHIENVFQKLKLADDEIQFFCEIIGGDITIEKFCEIIIKKLVTQQQLSGKRKFTAMNDNENKVLNGFLSELKNQIKQLQNYKFPKLIRIDQNKTQNQSDKWETIFTNEIACFKYCFDQASQLKNFWRDPEFGPTKGDPNGLRAIIGNQSKRPPSIPQEDEEILWMSYEQMIKERKIKVNPVFWNQQLKSTDVIQGNLGDCWYVSALSTITLNDSYIKGKKADEWREISDLTYGMIPPLFRCFAKYGMYVFKFFKKFKPVYVIIDELLPVQNSSKELIFAKSPQSSMKWVSFSEKAYAKLHHTYSNMISGDIAQGLNDLTNSLPIKQVLTKYEQESKKGKPKLSQQDLKQRKKQFNKKNIDKVIELNKLQQLMGCSIKIPKQDKNGSAHQTPFQYQGKRCGLVGGHAYSIIDCLDLKIEGNKCQLIRVRNPWGNSEWLLEWSQNPLQDDPDYKQLANHQKQIELYYKSNNKKYKILNPGPFNRGEDGQFLMPIYDWGQIFTNLFIGLNEAHTLAAQQHHFFTQDFWNQSKPSGVCSSKAQKNERTSFAKDNHQYIMEIKESGTEVLMLLTQQDGRLYRGQTYPYKELVESSIILVFNTGNDTLLEYNKENLVDPGRSLLMEPRRDVSYWRTYQKGKYIIIPCRKQKNKEKSTRFQFRIYSNNNQKIKLSKSNQISGSFEKRSNKTLSPNVNKSHFNNFVSYLQKQQNDIK